MMPIDILGFLELGTGTTGYANYKIVVFYELNGRIGCRKTLKFHYINAPSPHKSFIKRLDTMFHLMPQSYIICKPPTQYVTI